MSIGLRSNIVELPGVTIASLALSPAGVCWMACGTDGLLYASENGGAWLPIGSTSDPTDIEIADNTLNAFQVRQAANEYFDISTVNGAELITYGNTGAAAPNHRFHLSTTIAPGTVANFRIQDTTGLQYFGIDSTTGNGFVALGNRAGPSGASDPEVQVFLCDNFNEAFAVTKLLAGPTELHFLRADTTTGAETMHYGTAAAATTPLHLFNLRDNHANTMRWAEGATNILNVSTTNGTELVTWGTAGGAATPQLRFELRPNAALPFLITSQSLGNFFVVVTTTGSEAMLYGNAVSASTPVHTFNMRDNSTTAWRALLGANAMLTMSTANGNEFFSVGNATADQPRVEFLCKDNVANAWRVATAAGADRIVWDSVTGAEVLEFLLGIAASTIRFGDATSLMGFYGAAAVVKHATTGQTAGFTAGAGAPTLVDSTYTGGTGASAYTIGDVVRALKQVGLMTL